MDDPSIALYVSNQKAYCWDVQDVATLRARHRICGLFTGTLPGVSQQNVFLGLPMVLMPEEVVLLVENKICHLVYSPSAHLPPTSQQIAAHAASRISSFTAQAEELFAVVEEKKKKFERVVGDQDEVRRKREERKKAKEEKGKERAVDEVVEMFQPENALISPTQPSPVESLPKKDKAPLEGPSVFVPVSSTSLAHPWFSPATTYPDLPSALAAGIWLYPTTLTERARCATFRRLWSEGYFLGQGIKFGGEFLVYPGDPLRYHSHFVTTTIETRDRVLKPLELVAWGRLGTATKKAHLLCCFDDEADSKGAEDGQGEGVVSRKVVADDGSMECWSLEWGNFG